MELKNIKEYNPEYNKDGTLVWKKIGEKTSKNGKHLHKKKQYPRISIDKIKVGNYNVSEKILAKSRSLYWKTKEMIPVYLSYDFKLIGGFEQFEIAKELKLKSIPFQRNNKMNHKERKQFTNSVQNIKVGNKKYPVKAIDGSTIYVSMNHAKKVREAKRMATRLKCYAGYAPAFSGLTDISGKLASVSGAVGNAGTTFGDFNITIPIDHVENYEDIVTKLQKDRQFEDMILSMTVDRMMGKSSLAKHKYHWK